MIKSKIEDIEAGEEAVIRAGREAAKAKAREFRKSLGLDDDMGEDFAQADDVVGPSSAGTAAEFEQQLTTFGRFVESTGEYVPYLIRKAERVEEYQNQR